MPRFSVWSARASLLYFWIGVSFGTLMLINKAVPWSPQIWRLTPLHVEFLTIGWLVQLVFSIAYWNFPRFARAPKRGRSELAWLALALLNIGILLTAVAVFWQKPPLLVAGRSAELVAALLFASHIWGRVKPTETGKQVT